MARDERTEILQELKDIIRNRHPDLHVFLVDPTHHTQWQDSTPYSRRDSRRTKEKTNEHPTQS